MSHRVLLRNPGASAPARVGLIALLCLGACGSGASAPAHTAPDAGAVPLELERYAGQTVTILVEEPGIIAAHMMRPPRPDSKINYGRHGRYHLVLYSERAIDCRRQFRVTGRVRHVKGDGDPHTKSGSYSGYHIDATHWECLGD